MKSLNKIFYDILLKINIKDNSFKMNEKLVFKYFKEIENSNKAKYRDFEEYFNKFYDFCFEIDHEIVIKESLNFKSE